jgi:hypothetical protein
MTPQEVGRRVKEKYPQYKDMSDEEVGRKTIAKYPQYAQESKPKSFLSKISESIKSRTSNVSGNAQKLATGQISRPEYTLRGFGQVAGAVGDVAGATISGLAKTGFNALPQRGQQNLRGIGTAALQSRPGQAALGGLQSGMQSYGGFKERNPRLAENLEATGNIASMLPIGIGGKVVAKEGLNAAIDAGRLVAATTKGAGKAITGSLEKNVGKAVGMTGRMRLGDVEQSIPKAVNAFRTIAKNAKNTIVKDVDGIEKAFDPAKATFSETLQALKQTKDKLYNDWTKMAKEAGEQGISFTGDDFGRAIAELQQTTANSTSAWRNKVQSLVDDITKNYTDITPDGQVVFRDVDPADIQKFIERINVDINPMSDKAGSEVSALLSRSLRDMMDTKIDSTGPGYQALRNQYSELKSIENGLINQFKKSVRGVGNGVSKWVDGFGTLDTVVGLLTARPEVALRGVGMSLLAKAMKSLRDPENALKRSFKRILEEGGKKFTPKSSTGKVLQNMKGKGGMSIQDVSKKPFVKSIGDYAKENVGKVKDGKKIASRILNEMADFTEYAAKQKTRKVEYVLDEIRARKIAEKLGINPDVSNWELAKKFGKLLEKANWSRK